MNGFAMPGAGCGSTTRRVTWRCPAAAAWLGPRTASSGIVPTGPAQRRRTVSARRKRSGRSGLGMPPAQPLASGHPSFAKQRGHPRLGSPLACGRAGSKPRETHRAESPADVARPNDSNLQFPFHKHLLWVLVLRTFSRQPRAAKAVAKEEIHTAAHAGARPDVCRCARYRRL